MIFNKYGLMLVDTSWLLTRNLWMATKDVPIEEFSAGEVLRLTIQTIRKIQRDYGITADKVICVMDTWDKNLGGYFRTSILKPYVQFKGSRKYITEQVVEDMRANPETTPEELEKAVRECAMNKTKYEAKQAIIKGFPEIGIYVYGKPGLEFDDIATLSSFMRYNNDKKDVIVTTDSDLSYSLSPGCDMFRPKTSKNEGKIITYDEMYATIPPELLEKGMTLYNYHALMDSLGQGHNDLGDSKVKGADPVKTILKVMNGDFSDIENLDMFKAQMSTFDLNNFNGIDEVRKDIITLFETGGKRGTLEDFHTFCEKYNVKGISDKYFSDFSETFDPKLFCQR